MRTVLVVVAIVAAWFAVAFLLGPLIGRILKHGHLHPTGGPPPPPAPPSIPTQPDEPEPGGGRQD